MALLRAWLCWREILRFASLSQDDSVEGEYPNPQCPVILSAAEGSPAISSEFLYFAILPQNTQALKQKLKTQCQSQTDLFKLTKYRAVRASQIKPKPL